MTKRKEIQLSLEQILDQQELTQADLARGAQLSKAATNRIVKNDDWPVRTERADRQKVKTFLTERGVKPSQLTFLNPKKKTPATATNSAEVTPLKNNLLKKDIDMLLNFQGLDQSTLKHFGLVRNPFQDDVQSVEDVFKTTDIRYISAQLEDAARRHGFVAVVGESGAGKTTLAEELEEKLKRDNEVIIIKPHVLAMELNDIKGKTLKSSQLVEAIISALDPDASPKRSTDAKFRQVHNLLKESSRAGRKHLLLIEEAHCLPLPTLKHLKRFHELKDGLKRLLGVALIAQPELSQRLSSNNPEVREVAQRCEIIQLPPLDNDLKAYLQHKLARAGVKYEDIFTEDAVDAIRTRLTFTPRGNTKDARSVCYPLVVNNLVSRAMKGAAETFEDKVTAQVIASC